MLLGGGLAFGLSTCDATSEECREARAQGRPDAEQLCRTRSGGGHASSSSSSLRSASVTQVSERGGFGSHGNHFGGGS